MKCKVRMTHTVEFYVEGNTSEQIEEWLNCTTPSEAKDLISGTDYDESYNEEILCVVAGDSEVNYSIK